MGVPFNVNETCGKVTGGFATRSVRDAPTRRQSNGETEASTLILERRGTELKNLNEDAK
jgi:hypothetical protein